MAQAVQDAVVVCVADAIPVDTSAGVLRGHGTQLYPEGELRAAVCGVVARVNKLVTVRPLRSRYVAETGDVVVGRVTEVAQKRWKVDVNAPQEGQLLLSAINLPGGIQRRKNTEDELNMRSVYREGDVLSGEVQSSHQDAFVTLHTRSTKYGKLVGGQLVTVPPYLVKRMKQHFHTLPEVGVQVILGCNGYVWVGAPTASTNSVDSMQGVEYSEDTDRANEQVSANVTVPLEMRERICRVAMAVKALSSLGFLIFPVTIGGAYALSIENGTEVKEMLAGEFFASLKEWEARRRESEANKKGSGY